MLQEKKAVEGASGGDLAPSTEASTGLPLPERVPEGWPPLQRSNYLEPSAP